jgi:hypothetical protein
VVVVVVQVQAQEMQREQTDLEAEAVAGLPMCIAWSDMMTCHQVQRLRLEPVVQAVRVKQRIQLAVSAELPEVILRLAVS